MRSMVEGFLVSRTGGKNPSTIGLRYRSGDGPPPHALRGEEWIAAEQSG